MGGLVIETVRPGVQFVPDAAAAFRRAEAQVQEEFGRNIGVNSTYRSWDQQMSMYDAWNAYVGGWGPYPGHSKAIHPMYSRHTGGTALDSSDWGNARIRQILADNGFIRNQLHVPNEEHHFEYIRSKDKNYGKEIDMPLSSEDVKRIGKWGAKQTWNGHRFRNGRTPGQVLVGLAESMARLEVISAGDATFFKHGGLGEDLLWIYVMPNGDFVRIRDLETARLYKERVGRQSVTLSTEAIRLLVADLTESGGRDLTATPDGEVETSTQDD